MPNRKRVQLLRSHFPFVESAANTREQGLGFFSLAVQGANRQMRLTRVRSEVPDTRAQERAAGDRLQPRLGVGQAHKQAPPIVGQRHRHRRELTPLQVMRGKAAPTPLVFHFIYGALGITPIPVESLDGADVVRQVGDQHSVFVALHLGRLLNMELTGDHD